MNTENSLTPEQITTTFRRHNLANSPSITRITTGFTNEVYVVDDYILKVCVDTSNEPNFEREIFLYQALRGLARIPDPIVADTSKTILSKFYMIYQKIEGNPVGGRWHLLTDSQRREFIEALCQQLRRMDNSPMGEYVHRFGLNPHPVWQEEMVKGLFQGLATIRDKQILSGETLQAIETYIRETAYVLKEQKLGLVFWDVQLNNMLISSDNKLAGLIDFEGISITSIDFRLVIIRIMSERPHLFMSEEMEPYANVEDYKYLMEWYKEFYPALFDFPNLEKRIDLYELGDILHHLPAWPKTKQLHERLAKILGS